MLFVADLCTYSTSKVSRRELKRTFPGLWSAALSTMNSKIYLGRYSMGRLLGRTPRELRADEVLRALKDVRILAELGAYFEHVRTKFPGRQIYPTTLPRDLC